MSKVTSKLQVTIPKAVAERYKIQPGDDVQWQPAGEIIRLLPPGVTVEPPRMADRLERFDLATARQTQRETDRGVKPGPPENNRGWTREGLHRRGRAG